MAGILWRPGTLHWVEVPEIEGHDGKPIRIRIRMPDAAWRREFVERSNDAGNSEDEEAAANLLRWAIATRVESIRGFVEEDEDGKLNEFPYRSQDGEIDDDTWDMLFPYSVELVGAISQTFTLTRREQKNSSSPAAFSSADGGRTQGRFSAGDVTE